MYIHPSVPQGIGSRTPHFQSIPKSADTQAPYIKWRSTVSPEYPWVSHLWIWRTYSIIIEKIPI